MIKIKHIENGFIVVYDDFNINDEKIEVETVFEDIDIDDDKKVCMTRLLYFIAEHYGHQYDKWAKNNLNITWDKKGHKVD